MEEETYYMYAYVTRHGVNSENRVLHVGCSTSNRNSYPTWFSEGLDRKTADAVHDRIMHLDGSHTTDMHEAADIIKDIIEDEQEE